MDARKIVFLLCLTLMAGLVSATGSLTLSLNSLDPISVGGSTTLTATVSASGDSVSNVQTTITLPTGLSTSDSTTQSIGSLSAGQSSTKSWNISGDSAGSYTITVSATGTSVTTQTANATLTVNTPGSVDVTTTTTPASSLTAGQTTSLAISFSNSGGSSATVTASLSTPSGMTLTSGSASNSFDLNAGQSSSLSWTFSMDTNTSKTITVTITSTANNPDDPSYSISGPSSTTTTTTTTTSSTTTTTDSSGNTGSSGGESAPKISSSDVENPSLVLSETKFASVTATTPEGISFEREASYKLVKSSETGAATNVWAFYAVIKNASAATRRNVVVTETIPKEIASNVSLIAFGDPSPRVVQADPVVEWVVDELKPGEKKKFLYYVTSISDRKVSGDLAAFLEKIPPALIASEEKAPAAVAPFCINNRCDDSNPCTSDSCSEASDRCSYSNSPDGTNCGGDSICKAGKCVAAALTGLPKEKDSGMATALVAGAIVVVLAGYFLYTRAKKK